MFMDIFNRRRLAARSTYGQYASLAISAPRKGRNILLGIYHALMVLGVSAMCTLGVMFVKPDVADQLLALSPFADKVSAEQKTELAQFSERVLSADAVGDMDEEQTLFGNRQQQKWVTDWLARRYRVANDAANMLVSAAYSAAIDTKLDPLLILAVIGIESRFNPFAESPMGAQGLMQVMSRVHKDKFEDHGGVKAALNPVANIKVGSQILKEYVRRGGSVEAGLKSYVGAANHATDGGYGAKVLSEYRRLKDVANGKRVGSTVAAAPAKRSVAKAEDAEDSVTDKETLAAAEEGKARVKSL